MKRELKLLWEMRKEHPLAAFLVIAALLVSLVFGLLSATNGSYAPIIIGTLLFLFLTLLLVIFARVVGSEQKGFYYWLTVTLLSFVALIFMLWIVLLTGAALCMTEIAFLKMECDSGASDIPEDESQLIEPIAESEAVTVVEWKSFPAVIPTKPTQCGCVIQTDMQRTSQGMPKSFTMRNDCPNKSSVAVAFQVSLSQPASISQYVFRNLETRELKYFSEIFTESMFPNGIFVSEAQDAIHDAGYRHIDQTEWQFAYALMSPSQSIQVMMPLDLMMFYLVGEQQTSANFQFDYPTCGKA